jgi:predicted transcriptional regulator YheO
MSARVPQRVKDQILHTAMQVAGGVSRTLGDICEVAVYDGCDSAASAIWLRGNLTCSLAGAAIGESVLQRIRDATHHDSRNYVFSAQSGRLVKGSTILLRTCDGQPVGAMCVYLDISGFLAAGHMLQSLCAVEASQEAIPPATDNAAELIDRVIQEATTRLGRSPQAMSRADKLTVVDMLDQRGAFTIKRAAYLVAERLDVSRFTIYNYVREVRSRNAV